MKKFMFVPLVAALFLAGFATNALAANTNLVTITGSMVCAKCVLHETKTCQNVVQVQKDGKTVNYYLTQNKVSKAAHDPICDGTPEKVTVTGSVKEKDGKEVLSPTKIEVDKS